MTDAAEGQVDLQRRTSYADVPNRAVGYVIDAVLLTAALLFCAAVLWVLVGPVVSFDPTTERLSDGVQIHRGLQILNALVAASVSAVYFVGSWTLLRGSPGQRLLRMRLCSSRDAARVPVGRAALRWVLLGGPFGAVVAVVGSGSAVPTALGWLVTLAWYVLLIVTTARSPRSQGLHDRLAGTLVVKRAPPAKAPAVAPAKARVEGAGTARDLLTD